MKHARSCFFPAAALAALYRRRWQIERNFDDLKTSPGMNHLACQSTDMRKAEKNLRKFARMVEDKCMGWYVAATGFFPPVCMK